MLYDDLTFFTQEIQEGIQLRKMEKQPLNRLNGDGKKTSESCLLRFQIPGKVKTTAEKVNVLLQAQLGCVPVNGDPSLMREGTPNINN